MIGVGLLVLSAVWLGYIGGMIRNYNEIERLEGELWRARSVLLREGFDVPPDHGAGWPPPPPPRLPPPPQPPLGGPMSTKTTLRIRK